MPAPSVESSIRPENYGFLQEFVYRESGIVLEAGKHYLVDARLSGLTRENGLESLNDLCALLRATSAGSLGRQVVEAMTTNETYFFREPAQYDALRKSILPPLIESRQRNRKLSFWSAAASTGQEAYTLAILLLEMGLSGWNLDILCTDFSTQVLQKARAGKYLQIEVNRGLPTPFLLKYFRRAGLEWEIQEEVRRMVRFQQFDLRQSMRALGPFDVVFCRNVLIYFDLPTRKHIVEQIRGTLPHGGCLFLGTTETGQCIDKRFERKTVGDATLFEAR